MNAPREPADVLRRLAPRLRPGTFVFTCVPAGTALGGLDVVATMHESEGLTVVLPERQAAARGFPVALRCAWITLTAATSLAEVGVTAAFAAALARAGIACNVVAGVHHDHLFVPVERAADAMCCLGGAVGDEHR